MPMLFNMRILNMVNNFILKIVNATKCVNKNVSPPSPTPAPYLSLIVYILTKLCIE